jgi:protein kinase C substrate 80K-H
VPGSPSGTSNTTASLPGFWCKNKGHVGAYLPSSFVNDGVCDYEACCDGSDEWAGAGGVKCEDRCGAMGKEWRKAEEVKVKTLQSAMRKKEELVKAAKGLREGVEGGIGRLEAEIEGLEIKAEELKGTYEEVERRERGRVVKSAGKGSKVTILAGLAKDRVEELRESLLQVVGKRDKLREKVTQLEAILATFKEEYNPNFNDEGVKRAVKSWEDYAANKEEAVEEALERDIEQISKPDSETEGINWVEWETVEEETDTEAREYYNSIS